MAVSQRTKYRTLGQIYSRRQMLKPVQGETEWREFVVTPRRLIRVVDRHAQDPCFGSPVEDPLNGWLSATGRTLQLKEAVQIIGALIHHGQHR
jgi:hypothetical protein